MIHPSNTQSLYDVIIIGAGLSGLAAGIRLAHFNKKVLILEKHNAPGGLNSFYSRQGHKYDVGLHAMTNYPNRQYPQTPLTRVLRQLRIDFQSLNIVPQKRSCIQFPEHTLVWDNELRTFYDSVAQCFPKSMDAFCQWIAALPSFEAAIQHPLKADSGRSFLNQLFPDKQLTEMLLCALCYYGSARQNDIDFAQLIILFRSLFLEGFARPQLGIRPLIQALLERYRQTPGERRMKCGVKALDTKNDSITAVILETGEVLHARYVLSSIGAYETFRLLQSDKTLTVPKSYLSFVETMSYFPIDKMPNNWDHTITFYNDSEHFRYAPPEDLVDVNSGIICLNHNYVFPDNAYPEEACLKVTALANPHLWADLSADDYPIAKKHLTGQLIERAKNHLPKMKEPLPDPIAQDTFTPKTIERFTQHVHGSVYGSPKKYYDGKTPFDNLFLCGTDQGCLGIVGAMASGVSQANGLLSCL